MSNELRPNLNGDVDPITPTARLCRVLALSGGGYRGIFSARILGNLEKLAGRSASKIFDLIIGTSTGSLIGAAIALGKSGEAIEKIYIEEGKNIFRRKLFHSARRLGFSAPYSSTPLHVAIRKLITPEVASTPLHKLNIPFAAVALSHTREQARIFGAGKFSSIGENITLENAIVASAAAPTYFPSKKYREENLVDGGLVANAPELIGLALAKTIIGASFEDIRILAIGTASPSGGLPSLPDDKRGVFRWLLSRRGLVRLTTTAQEHLARTLTGQLIGDNYIAIDQAPSRDQVRAVNEMDNTSEITTSTLGLLAEAAWSNFLDDSRHRTFL